MAQDRLQIVISADSREADRAFSSTNAQMGSMEQIAARVANSIASHFQTMAREIQQAIQGLSGVFNGLNGQAAQMRQLVDYSGRPISNSSVPAYSPTSISNSSAVASMAALAQRRNDPALFNDWMDRWAKEADIAAQSSISKLHEHISRASEDTDRVFRGSRGIGAMLAGIEKPVGGEESFFARLKDLIPEHEMEAFNQSVVRSRDELTGLYSATTKVGDGMASSMFKAAAWFQVLEHGLQTVKALTIDSAKYAANTEMYVAAMHAVAQANGYTEKSVDSLAKKIQTSGISRQESLQAVTQMMTAGMDLNQLPRLTNLAKNLAVMKPGMTSSDVLTNLIYAIQSGQPEMLRTLGMNVNFETAYRREASKRGIAGGTEGLAEFEKMAIRLGAVLHEDSKFAGMYDQSMETVGKQTKTLSRLFDDAKNAIGDSFIPAMRLVVETATWALTQIDNHPLIAKATGVFAGGAAGAAVGAGVGALFGGVGAGPGAAIGFGLGSTAALVSAIFTDDEKKTENEAKAAAKRQEILAEQARQKKELEDARIADSQREALRAARRSAASAVEEAGASGLEGTNAIIAKYRKQLHDRLTYINPVTNEVGAFRDPVTERQYQQAANTEVAMARQKQARDLEREIAQEKAGQLEGANKLLALDDLAVARLKSQGDDTKKLVSLTQELTQEKIRGMVADAKLAARDKYEQALVTEKLGYAQITAEMQLQVTALERKNIVSREALEFIEKEADVRRRILDRQNNDETDRLRDAADKAGLDVGLQQLEESKSAALASVEQTNTYTLSAKLSLEQRKYKIELDYLQKIAAKKIELRQWEADQELDDLNKKLWRDEISQQQYNERRKILHSTTDADIARLNEIAGKDANDLARNTAKAQRELIQSEYTKLYDRLKQSAEGVFDAMLTKSQSVWSAMANAFKTAFLTVIKEIVTSNIARSFTSLLTGQNVQFASASGGVLRGPFGRFGSFLGGLGLGAVPVFGGGMATAAASGNSTYSVQAPSGTGNGGGIDGFVNQAKAASQAKGWFSGLFGHGVGSKLPASALKDAVSVPGSYGAVLMTKDGKFVSAFDGTIIGTKPGFWSASGSLGKAGPMAQAALFAGGMMIGMDGMQRGGLFGVAESTLGGAAIGTAIAPGIGTAIGAGVGLLAGGIRSLFRSSTQKMRDRILALTGVRVTENNVLKQAVEMAKSFGGNYDLFIRSKQGQDLIEMYAQNTGQKYRSTYNAQQFNMVQGGNGLYEMASYTNGVANNPLSNLPGLGFSAALDQVQSGGMSSAGPVQVTLQIDGPATTSLMRGEAVSVIASPQGQRANLAAQQASIGRTQTATALFSPMTRA